MGDHYMALVEKINKLGPNEYINCFLVSKNVREGFLFQTVDYNEYDISSPISKEKLNLITEYFPSLIHTDHDQGVLLSIKKFSLEDIENDSKLGKILGFPCQSLTKINKELIENPYLTSNTIDITVNIVLINNEKNIIKRSLNIISFNCLNYDKYKNNIDNLVSSIKKVLLEDSNMKLIIEDVKLKVKTIYNEENLIKLLSNNKQKLSPDQLLGLNNYLYNIGFDIDFQIYMKDNIDYNNPIHRGILIGLLTYSKYPTIEPFIPLQNYGDKKSDEVDEIIRKWGSFIIDSINLAKDGRVEQHESTMMTSPSSALTTGIGLSLQGAPSHKSKKNKSKKNKSKKNKSKKNKSKKIELF